MMNLDLLRALEHLAVDLLWLCGSLFLGVLAWGAIAVEHLPAKLWAWIKHG